MLALAPILALVAFATPALSLWPQPHQLTEGTTGLKLSSGFSIQLSGALAWGAPSDLHDAISRTLSQLKNDKMERLVVGGGATDAKAISKAKSLRSLTLSLTGSTKSIASITENAQLPIHSRVESYSLHVPSDGSAATLSAATTLGLFRGLTTFSQLWYTYESSIYTIVAPISITDKPAYPYRGFMLDTARNYFPVSDILRTLDGLSYVKANTFHWHIVDSQSFPLFVAAFPELSEKGAYSASKIYKPSDVKEIIAYAGARGIDVILEIDTPGHTAIIADAYPEFVACPNFAPWASFANEPPSGQLRLADPKVVDFTNELFKSVLSGLPGKYFSTGGDEINANCYNTDNATQASLAKSGKSFEQALSDFTVAGQKTLKSLGRTPVVWEEMVLAHNVTLSNETIVMVWISSEDAQGVVEKGFQIVHAASDYFYLDCGHGGWVGEFPQGNSWCDPFKTWQKAYSFDPLTNITAAQSHLVLGGQHLLWTEQSDHTDLDSTVWPRAGASAEIFWTGPTLPDGTAANPGEALARIHDLRYRLVQRGIDAIPLQPHWCAIRPHACDLTA